MSYRRQRSKPSPRKRNAKRQSGCLRRTYILLREEGKQRAKEKKIYIYPSLNAEFQRMVRRNKEAFLNEQCKEIEENNGMGKTRDLVKKIGDTEGTFHAEMGSIKERSHMDLTEAEEIKKRCQEYTEELYKKVLVTQITTMV